MKPTPLIKQGRSKRIDIEGQAPVKNLIIQFNLHISTKVVVSKLFKILYISSTLTNIAIPFISINFAVL